MPRKGSVGCGSCVHPSPMGRHGLSTLGRMPLTVGDVRETLEEP